MKAFEDIDNYIQSCPEGQRDILYQIREVISNAAPDAVESISYGMPTFKLNGNLVHFAAAKNHLGFYPGPSAIIAFKEELVGFKTSKGAIQIPMTQPLPASLISSIVQFRIDEQLKKVKPKLTIKS